MMDHERLAARRLYEIVRAARRQGMTSLTAETDDVEAVLACAKTADLEIPRLRGLLAVTVDEATKVGPVKLKMFFVGWVFGMIVGHVLMKLAEHWFK